jgi:cytochrome bd ubiquinol oxidase subunit II
MIDDLLRSGEWLPFAFALLIGVSMLLYAILDGYDLGVGLLSRFARGADRDRMIASIGPFWDANETWLVLGVGLLLVAFPRAHGDILTHLYLPVAVMIVGLIFRGVSFDFRKKVPPEQQGRWNAAFFWGSLVVTLSQGYMLGRFMIGFQEGAASQLYAVGFAALVSAGYVLMGACWLVLKCEDELQRRAARWARTAVWSMAAGAALTSVAAVFVDTRIYDRMLAFPEVTLLLALPVVSAALTLLLHVLLGVLPLPGDRLAWVPFAIAVMIFVLGFVGLVYSFFPYIIPGRMRIVEAAAAPESLRLILIGAGLVLPFLAGYTIFAYRVFAGKARDLSYD